MNQVSNSARRRKPFRQSMRSSIIFVNDGVKIFTEAGGAGALDKRGGTIDPRRVVIHNGRLHRGFPIDRESFRFVRHDTKVADFYDERKCGESITRRWKSW